VCQQAKPRGKRYDRYIIMKIALDIGAKTGYCVFDGMRIVECRSINLPSAPTKKEPSVLGRRYKIIKELLQRWQLTHVYYECTDWFRSSSPSENFHARLTREKQNRVVQRSLGRIEALIESAAVELNLVAVPVRVHDAKKNLTDNGNASKERVAKAVKDLFPQMAQEGSQDALDSVSIMAWAIAQDDPMWKFSIKAFDKNDY
jgi:Holliday junction resolvasome RuvABC endonuclease subunit